MITAHIVTVPDDKDFGRYFSERHLRMAAVPRTGEYFTINDREGIGQAFEVVAVIHPTNPSPSTATVEIRAKHVGTSTELFVRLSRGARPAAAE